MSARAHSTLARALALGLALLAGDPAPADALP